jgi:uncharacterized membrane protein
MGEIKMKIWVTLTILLYLLCVSIAVIPFVLVLSGSSSEASGVFSIFFYLFVPIFLVVQGTLLLVPTGIVHERPIRRRGIVISAVITAIPMAILTSSFFLSIGLMIWGEDKTFKYADDLPSLISLIIFWMGWGFVFLRHYQTSSPQSHISRMTRWLLRGSILELVVAIPSHIISRHRKECCAPEVTLLGIAAGLAIALLSFGPGIFFLFAQKIKSKRGRHSIKNSAPA